MMKEENSPPTGFVNEAFNSQETTSPPITTTSNQQNEVNSQPRRFFLPSTECENESCGWLSFRPAFLQRFRSSKWILFWLCWAAAVQGIIVNGFVNTVISTIEKRYNLKSASSAMIAGSYDVGSVLCSIPVSYLGSLPGASKPRWLGWGLLIMGFGSFVFTLPHFMVTNYDVPSSTDSVLLCLQQKNSTDACKEISTEWLSQYLYVFLLGQFLHGVGASPIYILGTAYLDESVPIQMSSLYLGIFHTMAVIGPAAGYVTGSAFLSIYINSPQVNPQDLGLDKNSDLWLGAWWIGFLMAGTIAILVSWVLISFPAEIPGSKERALQRTGADSHIGAKAFAHIGHMPGATKVLLRNATFILLSLAQAFDTLLISAFATFMPKIIENQFSVSASFAAILVGCIAVPAGGGGTFFGGWIVKRFQLKCKDILKLCFIASAVCLVFVFGFMTSCPETAFAGVNEHYGDRLNSDESFSLNYYCNANCGCDKYTFDPVCGSNEVMYFSPCYAGCRTSMLRNDKKIFTECKCINALIEDSVLKNQTTFLDLPIKSAIRQKCPSKCNMLSVLLIMLFIVMLLTFFITMPSIQGTLRCVPDTYRSFALGLQGIQVRVLGSIPGPLVFGAVMDSTCTLWQDTCSGKGSCRHYNNSKMSSLTVIVSLVGKFIATVLYFLSWWCYKRKIKERTTSSDEMSTIPNRTT